MPFVNLSPHLKNKHFSNQTYLANIILYQISFLMKNFTYYMQFERKFNADKMLLNEFCPKNVRVLVIASDLQMSVIKKLYFL